MTTGVGRLCASTPGYRRRRTQTALIVVLATFLAGLLAGCGRRETDRDELRAAIRATERLATRFVYTDERPERRIGVQGLIEDDFRFKARVLFDDADAYDEVVSDDTLAVRVLDPAQAANLVDKEKAGGAGVDTSTELAGVTAVQALQSRRWVLDPSGAPPQTGGAQQDKDLGRDPVLDAISALDYVERAIGEAGDVEQYDPDDLTPTYVSSEDAFPKPVEGSGITRYDLKRPKLPPPGQTSGARQVVPATKHFRKMVVYVKDGRVIQVQERVEIVGRFVEEFVRYSRAALRQAEVAPQVREQFERSLQLPREEFSRFALAGLNEGLQASGIDPVLVRNMALELRDLGQPVTVDLPGTDVVKGSLEVLVASGRAPQARGGAGGGGPGPPAPAAGG